MSALSDRLRDLDACRNAVDWAKPYSDPAVAWAECRRGDWMLWILGALNVRRQDLVRAACECARIALPHARGPKALLAIEAAEGWTRGDAAIDDVRSAAAATAAAAADAYAAYTAAAYAAYAAYTAAAYAAAADASAITAVAAAAAAATAATADAAAAHRTTLAQCANIVRRHFPAERVLAIWSETQEPKP